VSTPVVLRCDPAPGVVVDGVTVVVAGGTGLVTGAGTGLVTAGGTGVVGKVGDTEGGGVKRRESEPISVVAAVPVPVSQSRELGNELRERNESPKVPAVASGVPRDVLGNGPVRGLATGGATLMAAESGVVGEVS
jgi:hypothetical protein